MMMRVRLLKEHASHPIGAVLVLPRDEAARLHRLEVCVCLAEVPEDGEPQVVVPDPSEKPKARRKRKA